MDEWLTVREVALELGLSEATIYNACRAKPEIGGARNPRRIASVRVVEAGIRIHRSEVLRFRSENVCPVDLPDSGVHSEAPDA